MFYQTVPNSQQFLQMPMQGRHQSALPDAEAATQAWQLQGHRALSLCNAQAGVLRVVRGRLWATQTRKALKNGFQRLDLAARDAEDVVLQAGEKLQVAARQKVVVEALGVRADEAVWFQWEPVSSN